MTFVTFRCGSYWVIVSGIACVLTVHWFLFILVSFLFKVIHSFVFYIHWCLAFLHVCARVSDPLEWELQIIVSYPVDARN